MEPQRYGLEYDTITEIPQWFINQELNYIKQKESIADKDGFDKDLIKGLADLISPDITLMMLKLRKNLKGTTIERIKTFWWELRYREDRVIAFRIFIELFKNAPPGHAPVINGLTMWLRHRLNDNTIPRPVFTDGLDNRKAFGLHESVVTPTTIRDELYSINPGINQFLANKVEYWAVRSPNHVVPTAFQLRREILNNNNTIAQFKDLYESIEDSDKRRAIANLLQALFADIDYESVHFNEEYDNLYNDLEVWAESKIMDPSNRGHGLFSRRTHHRHSHHHRQPIAHNHHHLW